jgi:hypothetical protein
VKRPSPSLLFPLILLVALAVRVPWLGSEGYARDIVMIAEQIREVPKHGYGNVYTYVYRGETYGLSYGPVYAALGGGAAWLWMQLSEAAGRPSGEPPVSVAKLPNVAADLLIGVLIYRFARRRLGILPSSGLASLYLFNPGTILNSAWWGQTDALAAAGMVLAITALCARDAIGSCTGAVLSLLTKLQAYFVAPLVFVVLARTTSARAMVRGAIVSAVVGALLCLPLILSGTLLSLPAMYLRLVGRHPAVSVNAFNVWWIGLEWGSSSVLDNTALWGSLTYRQTGILLLAGYSLAVLWRLWVAPRLTDVPLAATCLAVAFFMLPTQIHSRYLLPALPLLLLACVARPTLLAAYVTLSFTFIMNQAHILLRAHGAPPLPDWWVQMEAIGFDGSAVAWINLVVFLTLTGVLIGGRVTERWQQIGLSWRSLRPAYYRTE